MSAFDAGPPDGKPPRVGDPLLFAWFTTIICYLIFIMILFADGMVQSLTDRDMKAVRDSAERAIEACKP